MGLRWNFENPIKCLESLDLEKNKIKISSQI